MWRRKWEHNGQQQHSTKKKQSRKFASSMNNGKMNMKNGAVVPLRQNEYGHKTWLLTQTHRIARLERETVWVYVRRRVILATTTNNMARIYLMAVLSAEPARIGWSWMWRRIGQMPPRSSVLLMHVKRVNWTCSSKEVLNIALDCPFVVLLWPQLFHLMCSDVWISIVSYFLFRGIAWRQHMKGCWRDAKPTWVRAMPT